MWSGEHSGQLYHKLPVSCGYFPPIAAACRSSLAAGIDRIRNIIAMHHYQKFAVDWLHPYALMLSLLPHFRGCLARRDFKTHVNLSLP